MSTAEQNKVILQSINVIIYQDKEVQKLNLAALI